MINYLLKFLKTSVDILTPRFVTEKVALQYHHESKMFEPICAMKYVCEGDQVDASIDVRSFNLLGFALFSTQLDDTLKSESKLGDLIINRGQL